MLSNGPLTLPSTGSAGPGTATVKPQAWRAGENKKDCVPSKLQVGRLCRNKKKTPDKPYSFSRQLENRMCEYQMVAGRDRNGYCSVETTTTTATSTPSASRQALVANGVCVSTYIPVRDGDDGDFFAKDTHTHSKPHVFPFPFFSLLTEPITSPLVTTSSTTAGEISRQDTMDSCTPSAARPVSRLVTQRALRVFTDRQE